MARGGGRLEGGVETKESPKLNLEGSAQAQEDWEGKKGEGGRRTAGEEKAFLFKRLFEVYHPPHKVGIRSSRIAS